jgi:hypothetical protein
MAPDTPVVRRFSPSKCHFCRRLVVVVPLSPHGATNGHCVIAPSDLAPKVGGLLADGRMRMRGVTYLVMISV